MSTYVALLRGINLGGHNRVAMQDLRDVVSSLGYANVTTYIQSGNVVFTGPERDPLSIAAGIEEALAAALDVAPDVVTVPHAGLARVVEENPYPDLANPKLLHAIFRDRDPGPGLLDAIADAQQRVAAKGSRDEVTVAGRTLYLHTPDGFGRSELAALLTGIALSGKHGGRGTARNWATVTRLLSLCAAAEAAEG